MTNIPSITKGCMTPTFLIIPTGILTFIITYYFFPTPTEFMNGIISGIVGLI